MKTLLTTLALLGAAASACAQSTTPVGLWKTIDDETRTEKSLVRISEQGDALVGRVEKLLDPKTAQDTVCDKCSDERKGKPILGMTIIRNARAEANGQSWEGGEILDPAKGKTYRLKLTLKDGGKRLEVRGYLGPFFRDQYWVRVE